MEVDEVVGVVTADLGLGVDYLRPLRGGSTVGAHLVLPAGGPPAVLKFGGPPQWLAQIRQAAESAEQLAAIGYPTPRIWATGTLPSGEWWYLQDYVDGDVIADEDFGPAHFAQLLGLLRRNKGLGIDTRQDWSAYVVDLVYGHSHDWETLEASGSAVRAMLERVSTRVATLPRVVLGRDDLVLGDPAPSNLVFKDGQIAGVVDFECAGRGDSLIDVVALLERFRHRGEFLDALVNAEFSADRFPAVRLCGTATVLSGLNWRLQHGQPTENAMTAAEGLLDFYWDLTAR